MKKLLVCLVMVYAGVVVRAATFTPTTTSDFPVSGTGVSVNTGTGVISGGAGNGQITLRSAVIAADAHPGSVINIPAGVYTLTIAGDDGDGDPDPTIGDLDIATSPITITGAGPASTIIQAGTSPSNGIDQILTLNWYYTSRGQSAVINGFSATVTGITFRYGRCVNTNTQSGSFAGGAISFDAGYDNGGPITTPGLMTLSNCVFDSCSAHYGAGAIMTFDGGTVTIDSCVFTNNQGTPFTGSSATGGAIVFGSTPNSGVNTVKNTTFANNQTIGAGGALYVFGGTADPCFIHNCLFTGNYATGEGGAIYNYGAGSLTIDQGTIVTNNTSAGAFAAGLQFDAQGGGLYLVGGPTVVSNCTIINNTASLSSSDQRGGGGIAVGSVTGSLTINNCRIVGNAANTGTGLHKDLNPGTVVANNNWWGNNGGPGVGGADTAVIGGAGSGGGALTLTGWLVASLGASPAAILTGGTSTLTAGITQNSSGASGFTVPNGTPVSFGGTLGAPSPASTALLSGTATSTFTAGSSGGLGSATATVDHQSLTTNITVSQKPLITSAAATTFTVGTAGLFTVTDVGYPAPALSVSGALPNLVGFNPGTGSLTGTPAAGTGGTYPLTFTATNSAGTNTQSFTLTVNEAPAFTNASSTTFLVGRSGTFKIAATGFPAPTLSESNADTRPGGVTFTAATGNLGGTPSSGSGGTYTLHFTAHNGVGSDATQTFALTVDEAPTVTCPANIMTNAANGVCTPPSVSFAAAATGFPAPGLGYQMGASNITSPATFPVGTNVVTCTATNPVGTNQCSFTVIVSPGAAPQLQIARQGTNVVIFWPTNFPCYVLQSAPAVSSKSWSVYTAEFVTVGTNVFATNALTATNRFFRLMH